ncbi:protein of unknown function [Paraburkholderia dioscoreae]|uniref:Uncharacterized protein n=1 Tax=Paraburkholderia dioscoreae TaxID=2604047 RepID=A0A5Q4ZAJ3_9BURK|nr:protein of unknown function [Paraburkholderia dioscoreae]
MAGMALDSIQRFYTGQFTFLENKLHCGVYIFSPDRLPYDVASRLCQPRARPYRRATRPRVVQPLTSA